MEEDGCEDDEGMAWDEGWKWRWQRAESYMNKNCSQCTQGCEKCDLKRGI